MGDNLHVSFMKYFYYSQFFLTNTVLYNGGQEHFFNLGKLAMLWEPKMQTLFNSWVVLSYSEILVNYLLLLTNSSEMPCFLHSQHMLLLDSLFTNYEDRNLILQSSGE